MQLKQFLDQIQHDTSFLEKDTVIAFGFPEGQAPIVFAAQLISFFKDKQMPLEMFGTDDLELSHIYSRLETSFLGMKICYWLRGIEALDKKSRQQLLTYVAHYKGPHHIFLLGMHDEINFYFSKRIYVELPRALTPDLAVSLLVIFKNNNPVIAKNIKALITKNEQVNLDQFCMLISYMRVVGKADDYNQILDRVIESEHSLFDLAQHFFAKNSTDFYQLWNLIDNQYPLTFWCVYWSEQLWRAYHVRYFLAKSQLTQAKAVSARLPFSFIQKDWKKSSLTELKNAHQWVYDLDRAYKNNSEPEAGIDLFYNKFFLNEFQG